MHKSHGDFCCAKLGRTVTKLCRTVCPGEESESKSRLYKWHATGKRKKKKKRRRKSDENSSDSDAEFASKQRDSTYGSPRRVQELPDIIPKQVK